MITLPSLTATSTTEEIMEFMQGAAAQLNKLPAEEWGKLQNHVNTAVDIAENTHLYTQLRG